MNKLYTSLLCYMYIEGGGSYFVIDIISRSIYVRNTDFVAI